MLRVPVNLASHPFFNNRKFYALSLLLGFIFVVVSAANLYFYLSHRSKSLRLNQELANKAAETQRLEREQEKIWERLQQPETEDFLNLVDYLNPLIAQRTFSWTRFLNHLENLVPNDLQIVAIAPRIVDSEIVVEIICNARAGAHFIEFISRLESASDFYGVNLVSEDLSKSPDFFGKQYQLQVRYQAQKPQEPAVGEGPFSEVSRRSVP